MKRLYLMLLMLAMYTIGHSQENRTDYIGVNIPPAFRTAIELGVERNFSHNLMVSLYGGYLINTDHSSWIKVGTATDFTRKSGAYVKTGVRWNLRRDMDKFCAYIGANLVHALALEAGTIQYISADPGEQGTFERKNSYNLGANGEIGLTSSATRRLNFDLGMQFGYVVVDNLLDFHSFMPGMGTNRGNGLHFQPVLRVKYRLGK